MIEVIQFIKKDSKLFRLCMSFIGERQNIILLFIYSIWLVLPLHKPLIELNFISANGNDLEIAQLFFMFALTHTIILFVDKGDSGNLLRVFRYLLVFMESIIWVGLGTMSLLAFPPSLTWIGYFWFFYCSTYSFKKVEPDMSKIYESVV